MKFVCATPSMYKQGRWEFINLENDLYRRGYFEDKESQEEYTYSITEDNCYECAAKRFLIETLKFHYIDEHMKTFIIFVQRLRQDSSRIGACKKIEVKIQVNMNASIVGEII